MCFFLSQPARSEKDGYASDTGQQEYFVALHLYAFSIAARGETPKKPHNCSGTAGVLTGSRRRSCADASRNAKSQDIRGLAMLSQRTGYLLACRARGR